jgi:predicted metalloenzyme YecM
MCKKCDITELQDYAKNKGGKLLSTNYINSKTKMLWECEEGHQWEVSWNSIKQDTWCPSCSREKSKSDITELQEYAKNKEGKLISDNYINSITKMLWKCKEGHQWEAKWTDIKNNNSWCPECASFKTELRCKELLEAKFGFCSD